MSLKIKELSVVNYKDNGKKIEATYRINEDLLKVMYPTGMDYKKYIISGGKIIDEDAKPAYGFKLVRNSYKQYIYVKTYNNAVIPYIFDYATNFDKDGLAMVAKDGYVTWINKDFFCLDNLVRISNLSTEKKLEGWKSISAFSEGEIPLSRCYKKTEVTAYVGKDLKPLELQEYDGEKLGSHIFIAMTGKCSEFTKEGYAFSPNKIEIISDKGYYISAENFVKKASEINPEQFLETAFQVGALEKTNKDVNTKKTLQKRHDETNN